MLTVTGALLIGLTLGLLGSGGSILTVPVLVYVLGHEGKTAIAESLAIVGGISLVSTLQYARARQVEWKSVVYFGIPGMAGTWGGAWLSRFVPGAVQLVLFAVVMVLAAVMMMRRPQSANGSSEQQTPASSGHGHPLWQIMLEGLAVGILTGLVGVGGGFLIVPALVILGGLPMRLAVGTSLLIVAMKSASGIVKYLSVLSSLGDSVDWHTIGIFLMVGIAGAFAGNAVNQRVNQRALQRVFAGFLIVMGGFVLTQEIPRLLQQPRPAASGKHPADTTGPDGADTPRTAMWSGQEGVHHQ